MDKEVCNLANSKCVPCQGGTLPMSKRKTQSLLRKLKSGWIINNIGHLYKKFVFPDFIFAMKFANDIAIIAEQEGHHPNLYIAWGYCVCEIWTHKISGLSESDFYLAAKIESLSLSNKASE
jgi:4a-hydroxytetrahydrobiopterin dehydratase